MSFNSPHPDVEIPELSVYDYIFGSLADADLDQPALVTGSIGSELTVSYRELVTQINLVAGALTERGLSIGDVVAVHSPNTPEFASVLHGILRAGGIATPVNSLYTAADVTRQLNDANAKFVFTTASLYEQAKSAAENAGIEDEFIIVIDGAPGHVSLQDLLDQKASAPDISFDPRTQIAVLPFSSGTTGVPKGVVLTHRNLVANIAQMQPVSGITADDAILAVLPFFHIYGMTVLLNIALKLRARLVTMPKFDLREFLDAVASHRLTYLFIAPPIAVALAKHPLVDQFDLSSVHTIVSGAAPLDEKLGTAVADRLKVRVRQGYGMSELSPVSHFIPFDCDDVPVNSVGFPLPNTVNKIVDPEHLTEISIPIEGMSIPGELWVKGPNVMAGYLKNPSATAEIIDEDGFLHTGDIAVVDSRSAVYIVDRLKELIKYKGYQVPPAELEALLLTHPEIADAAVIGVLDKDREEVPKAFVVKQIGSRIDESAVIDFVAARVSPHKKVRQVEFIEGIPKSSAGKILRQVLRTTKTPAV